MQGCFFDPGVEIIGGDLPFQAGGGGIVLDKDQEVGDIFNKEAFVMIF